ncbi:MAG: ATP-binding protein, partial [Chloroflexota bacterium]
MNLSLDSITSFFGIAAFGLLIVLTAMRWRLKESAIATFSLYMALGLGLNIGIAIQTVGIPLEPNVQEMLVLFTEFVKVTMPAIFGALTLAFLDRRKTLYWYTGAVILLLALWTVVYVNPNNFNQQFGIYLPILETSENVLLVLEVLLWAIASLLTPITILASLRVRKQAQFRNRLRYWLGVMLILSIANIITLLPNPMVLWLGITLNIISAFAINYILVRSHLPDLHFITGYLIRTLIITFVLSILFFILFYGIYFVDGQQFRPADLVLSFIITAVILALLIPRMATWLEIILNRILLEAGYDENSAIRAYSQSVSTEWDFEKLGNQALSFILNELNVERGILFINEGDGSGHVTLKLISATANIVTNTGYFFAEDPWVAQLRQKQVPVTQYDIDVLQKFRAMDSHSKDWLKALEMEIFFPVILRQRELMGVLALGSKPGNRPYLEADINRINVLCAQIAIDIDKAKMFNQLGAVNQKMGSMLQKFESLDRGKADFLSIASHELRTPLTHIHGYANMLMEATEAELQDPAYLQHIFNGIAKGSNRLKGVVDLIFDVSKAEMGEMSLAFHTVNLNNVVQEASERQEDALKQRNHTLAMSGIDKLPEIQGSYPRLVQALEQLINNAIKYTPDNGTITVTGRNITEHGKSQVELIITDTGIGIDPKDHTRIFDKFFRVGGVENHSSGSVKFKGAGPGLGLPLVSGIIQAHGGRIWVESPEYNEANCPG